MRNAEAMLLLLVVFGSIAFLTWISHRAQDRRKRFELIEKAIDDRKLDEETRRDILALLGAENRTARGDLPARAIVRRFVFALGWMTMVVGAGLWITGEASDWPLWDIEPAAVATWIGFALVTLPVALEEIENRRLRGRA